MATDMPIPKVETDDRKRVRSIVFTFKLATENERVRLPWRPFMALCEAVYPFFNPVVFHKSTFGRAEWLSRFIDNYSCYENEPACGMLLEAAAVGAGAERCARQLRARFYDRRLEPKILPYLRRMLFRQSTAHAYRTLDALLRRYDALAAHPWMHGMYFDFNRDPEAMWAVLRRCKVSQDSLSVALLESLKAHDGLFVRCLRWAERCHDGGEDCERATSGAMLLSFSDNAISYCDAAAQSRYVDAIRAIAESPLFDVYGGPNAAPMMLEYMARHSETLSGVSDEEYDLLLQALHADTKVSPELLYFCAARCGEAGNGRMMCKLLAMLRSAGGVAEFRKVDRILVAISLSMARGWQWEPCEVHRRAVDAAADLVCLVKERPFLDEELDVLNASKAKRLRIVNGEAVGIVLESVPEGESESDSSSKSSGESENEDAEVKSPDVKRRKYN